MIFTRLECHWFLLFIIVFNGDSYSSVGHDREKFIARAILKDWREKADEQRARVFLPKNVESSYTPVIIEAREVAMLRI